MYKIEKHTWIKHSGIKSGSKTQEPGSNILIALQTYILYLKPDKEVLK